MEHITPVHRWLVNLNRLREQDLLNRSVDIKTDASSPAEMLKAVKKAGNNEIVRQEKTLLGNSETQFIVKASARKNW